MAANYDIQDHRDFDQMRNQTKVECKRSEGCLDGSKQRSVEWDPQFECGREGNELATAEEAEMPKSGIRRSSVAVGMANGMQNATFGHDGMARPKTRNGWLKVKKMFGRKLSWQSTERDVNECDSLSYASENNSKVEEIVGEFYKVDYFQKRAIVEALPEGSPSHETITVVTRSFEVNSNARQNWSVLKAAVMSGNTKSKLEDVEERSGLRTISLPLNTFNDASSDADAPQGRSGWSKVKKLLNRRLSKQSSSSDVIVDSSYYDKTDGSCAEVMRATEAEHCIINEEMYTEADSAVQALPDDVISKGEVVAVTRSFEYNSNWMKARDKIRMLRQIKKLDENNNPVGKNDNCLNVKEESLKSGLALKDASCQTYCDFGNNFMSKQFLCEACGSKYEERQEKSSKNDGHNEIKTRSDDDNCQGMDIMKECGKNKNEEMNEVSTKDVLVKYKDVSNEEGTDKDNKGKGGEEFSKKNFPEKYKEKAETDYNEVICSADFQKQEIDGFSARESSFGNETALESRAFNSEEGGVVSDVLDKNDIFDDERKERGYRLIETKSSVIKSKEINSNVQSLSSLPDESFAVFLDFGEVEKEEYTTTSLHERNKENLQDKTQMNSMEQSKKNFAGVVQSTRNPVIVCARLTKHPSLKQVKIVNVKKSLKPCDIISYV